MTLQRDGGDSDVVRAMNHLLSLLRRRGEEEIVIERKMSCEITLTPIYLSYTTPIIVPTLQSSPINLVQY